MLRSAYLRRQDGFIREILWVAVVIAIAAVVVLDGMSIFTAHQAVRNDSATAAKEARTEFAQTLSLPAAKIAAQQYLSKSGLTLLSFTSSQSLEGTAVFTVKSKASAPTYVFRFLGIVPGLKKWVDRTTHPVGSGSSE